MLSCGKDARDIHYGMAFYQNGAGCPVDDTSGDRTGERMSRPKPLTVLSVCDGISTQQLALESLGIPVGKYYASEVDKYAEAVSRYHFPDIIRLGDLKNWRDWDIDTPDLITGGTPCQDLSVCGKGAGLNGERSGLFWEFAALIEKYQPRYFFFENVIPRNKNDRDAITRALGVEPILINAALVSAQQRKRFYWTNIPGVYQPEDRHIYLKDILESGEAYTNKAYTLTCSYSKGKICKDKAPTVTISSFEQNNFVVESTDYLGFVGENRYQQNRVYSVRGKSVSIKSNGGGGGANTGLYKIDLPDGDYVIRKLTPIECCRLMTLPDDYTANGVFLTREGAPQIQPISKTRQYQLLGNGWVLEVIKHLQKNLINSEDI